MTDEPYYVADGMNTSADGESIQCPRCGTGVDASFPEFDCNHCGQTITFVVAKKGSIPTELADWEAAQTEFQELRTQVAGQEEFIQEHEEKIERLEAYQDVLEDLGDVKKRLDQLERMASEFAQFEDAVRNSLSEVPSNE